MRALIADLDAAPDVESRSSAVVAVAKLCIDAEGPGEAFTRTIRGKRLLALIHVVVRSCGLSDKVGALTALRILKTDDLALRAYAGVGVIPAILRAFDGGDFERERRSDGNYGLDVRGRAAAARALSALASSSDVCKTLVRGRALRVLAKCVDDMAKTNEMNEDARHAIDALTRVSERTASLDARALFPISTSPTAVDLTCESATASLVEVLMSEMSVAHVDAAMAIGDLARSSAAGRRAVARSGAVIPLVTASLGGTRLRTACVDALRAIAGVNIADGGVRDIVNDEQMMAQDREELSMDEIFEKTAHSTASADANFFHTLVDILRELLKLRFSLEPAAADAALALWALVWQASNKTQMVRRVTGGLVDLARDGCSTSRDDAVSVLSVLALDEDGRRAISARGEHGEKLLDYILAQEGQESSSPRWSSHGLTFDESLNRRRSFASREQSSSSLSLAISRLGAS